MYTLGILTSSDMGAEGKREDTSGQAIREMLVAIGFSPVRYEIVPDERLIIAARLAEWADSGEVDLVVTTGGTGLGPRDVTPEATLSVIDRHVPGISEAMRLAGMQHTQMAMLSRGVSGVRGRCLIVNLPGSQRAVRECLEAIAGVLPHSMELLNSPRVETHPT